MKIRVYTIKELSVLYYPHYSPRSASMAMSRLIRSDRELLAELSALGFVPGTSRILTPAQVRCIVRILGEPE